MKIKNIFSIIFILLTIIGINFGCGKKEKEPSNIINLKLGHSLDINHPVHKAMEFWSDTLKKVTNGRIIIKIYPAGQLGTEKDLIEQLQMGIIDLAKVSSANLEAFVPKMRVLGMPYLFKNRDHKWKILNSDIGKELLNAGLEKNLVGIGFYEAGERSFYTIKRPINTPKDLKNMKIRVIKSPMAIELLECFGASPTPISWAELYTALQQGLVDGAENNPPSFVSARHYEICKYYSLDEHTSPMDVVLASKSKWDNLKEEDKRIIKETFLVSVGFQKKLWNEEEKRNFAKLDSAGVKIIIPDKEPFIKTSSLMYEKYANDEVIGELIKKIKEFQEK
ncbi:MAG: TRAP transporter substrate-binding protein [candidate division WOR-3 bacterium]